MSALIGITGSIGMGKSTVAKMFQALGCPVWDADLAVHALYAQSGAAVEPIAAMFPDVIEQAAVSRGRLKDKISQSAQVLSRVEAVVHPLLKGHREAFINAHEEKVLIFDIPLLFETHAEDWLDCVIVVSAPAEMQRARVFARNSISEAHFQTVLSKQTPDAQKRKKADYVIENIDLESTKQQVASVMEKLKVRYGGA